MVMQMAKSEVPVLADDALRQELAALEHKHDMPSKEFYELFRAGKLKDSAELVRWAGLCALAVRHKFWSLPSDQS